ncbi:hypothetical protein [Alcaligenes faecalis]|uniref:hypothetical protein n=1 Tax=Alcaligenes faecalis TaxID=511 RepID=UPI00214FD66F|nr:hypothetical protein [Alcaligenes faecalis]MCR4144897.1 hypothetical protein [Alcaligenes faecalis]
MSYNYAQLRAALANGPTPGPRSINEVGDSHRIVVRGGSVSGVMAFVETGWPHPEQQSEQRANALLIAAANPETIFALLAERDAQAAEIERLRAALILAEGAMNYMGDILNGMDAVEPEDEQATEPAFLAVRAALSGEPT